MSGRPPSGGNRFLVREQSVTYVGDGDLRVTDQQLIQLLPLVAFFAVLYLMMIRPQQVQQRK